MTICQTLNLCCESNFPTRTAETFCKVQSANSLQSLKYASCCGTDRAEIATTCQTKEMWYCTMTKMLRESLRETKNEVREQREQRRRTNLIVALLAFLCLPIGRWQHHVLVFDFKGIRTLRTPPTMGTVISSTFVHSFWYHFDHLCEGIHSFSAHPPASQLPRHTLPRQLWY